MEEKLLDSYRGILSHLRILDDRICRTEADIKDLSRDQSINVSARIAKLQEQIEKIDEYLLKVKGFQELAKRNLDSQNLLTIEAPPGYRVNLNRLRNWAMMIDPLSANDPYAQRVFAVAKCDECFLEKKKVEFQGRIKQLTSYLAEGNSEEIARMNRSLETCREELRQYAAGSEMAAFCEQVVKANDRFRFKVPPAVFNNPLSPAPVISPGAYTAALPFEKEQRIWLKSVLGDYYDADNSRVLLPVEMDAAAEYVMTVTCAPSKRKRLDRALQSLVLQVLNTAPAGTRKFYILDGVRFNTSSMGSLRQLEESFAMGHIPRNPDQLTSALEELVSSFADMDELIEQYDSVSEYNAAAEPDKKLPLSTVILFGWPSAFSGRDRDLAQRIMTNYERYGISVIAVNYRNADKKDDTDNRLMPEYALQNAIHISMLANSTTIAFPDGEQQHFSWYSLGGEIGAEYVSSFLRNQPDKKTIGNDYTKRYPMGEIPPYTREYKKIVLPFGIDGRDAAHSVSFENENFAAYLVGASRSGKSTLLHTLIAGLIRNYHPDNVELWLADFKQLEFKKYIEHRPPHVKYILLDESPELVYDLIDKLTEKMMERQRLFAQLGKERIDQIDTSTLKEPLPVIFVILDEFSIMSQSIADSDSYKLRLQNLLAKGAALGIKFLFSSQTFTTGVAGLTPTARAQIQQRISMKGTKDEINETLELSANIRTEQVTNWMEALPPHYALIKHRISADTLPVVNRFLVMYIPDYSVRDKMIEEINQKIKAVEDYEPGNVQVYMDKKPVVVDGNSYESFNSHLEDLKRWMDIAPNREEFTGDELFLNLGTPRRMEAMIPVVFAPESRENVFFIANSSEMVCAGAVLLSAMRSFEAQGGKVHIWAYSRNRLYRIYRDTWEGFSPAVDIDDVCDEIRNLKRRIEDQEEGRDLIVFLGMERIWSDFELQGPKKSGSPGLKHADISIGSLLQSGGLVEQAEDEPDLLSFLNSQSDGSAPPVQPAVQEPPAVELAPAPEEPLSQEREETGAYNASDDLVYILSQGSRLGYHMITVSNSLADFKQTGIKLGLFRHRLSFQIPKDDSWEVFGNGSAAGLPDHICRYSDTISSYSFRPYLHKEFSWDGWQVTDQGTAENKI